MKPDAKLTHVLTNIRPKDTVLEPLLDPRDSLPDGRVAYRLVLTYSFNVGEGGKFKAAVPLTNGWVKAPTTGCLTSGWIGSWVQDGWLATRSVQACAHSLTFFLALLRHCTCTYTTIPWRVS
jgi:hypothetical protein